MDAPEEIHLGRKPDDLLETLVNMVLGSPAICIYRSNGRSTARATSLAKVFVNNFNLPESTAIIDLAYGRCKDDNSHWQNVLTATYIADTYPDFKKRINGVDRKNFWSIYSRSSRTQVD